MYNITTTIKQGGIETYCWEVSRELKQLGYSIEIVSGKGDFIKYDDIRLQQFHYIKRENIFNLGNRFKKWGERVSFFINAYKYIKQQSYDVFIIHKPLDFFTCFVVKRINPSIKTVFISGGEDFYGFDKFFSKFIDIMVSVSNDNKKKIENRYRREVNVIPNGVDINKFQPNVEFRQSMRKFFNIENNKILISVGRVVGLKGFQLVVEALDKLDQEYVYVLIGDGEFLVTLKELAKEKGVENRVLFLGNINNKELPQYLNMGDVYIQPTIGNEAFGITIIEAMACGLPVVASKNGGILDIIKDKQNGLLFDINDTIQMIDKIHLIDLHRRKIIRYNTELIMKYFTWKIITKKLVSKLNEVT